MGSIKLSPPGPFVAGSYAELTLVYTAGTFGIDDTGMVKISWRTTSDMSKPQFDKPAGGELHHGRGEQRRQARSLVRPAQHPALCEHAAHPRRPRLSALRRHADHPDGRPPAGLARLSAADQLSRSMSSCKTSVDAFATYEFCELPEQPAFDLVPGPAASWKAIWPSLAVVGEPFRLAIVAEDMWGNPTDEADATLALVPSRPVRGLPRARHHQAGRGAARDRESRRRRGRRCRTAASWPDGKEVARANPMRVVASAPLRRYWGDLHGQSGETIGMGSAEDYFRYARDAAFVDMVGHQGNDFQITDAFWTEAQPAHRGIRRARTLRLPAGLRMVGQHRHGRRPQHLLPPRRPADPPLVAHPGRRPDLDRRDLHRRRAVSTRCKARMRSSSRMSAAATPT